MMLTAALLHGSLRWDILKSLGRAHEAQHDVGPELQEGLVLESLLPELARQLHTVGQAPWSASVLLGKERWALALMEVPSGPGHPRLAVELLALRVEHTRLLNAGDGQLQEWVLSAAREGSFSLTQRDLSESIWLKTDVSATSPERGLFFGSRAAFDAINKLIPVTLVGTESNRKQQTVLSSPPAATPVTIASSVKHIPPPETQVSIETQSPGTAVLPRWLKMVVALQSLCIADLLAAVIALFIARLQEAKEGEVARKQAVEQALKSQRLDLQSELLNDRETNRTALSARPTHSELEKKLSGLEESLEDHANANKNEVAKLAKSLKEADERIDDLKAKVDQGGFAGDQAERLKKISDEITRLEAQTGSARSALEALRDASKKLHDVLNPERK